MISLHKTYSLIARLCIDQQYGLRVRCRHRGACVDKSIRQTLGHASGSLYVQNTAPHSKDPRTNRIRHLQRGDRTEIQLSCCSRHHHC
ncbi:hypothetical protein BU16DRAFT_47023 [Lophium mytilinum]|uniref:Uncharacterized protein n=1 Tax=Lophium mytilinum TaxID=390894 RepID=A0A6A6QRV7_9PEZI|nr:hypothetical protein BU16DRAFT_47023 [Lophium mytilinum]